MLYHLINNSSCTRKTWSAPADQNGEHPGEEITASRGGKPAAGRAVLVVDWPCDNPKRARSQLSCC